MKSLWLDEFERMNRMLRDVMEAPAQKILREMDQYRQLVEPPGYQALREIQGFAAEARRVGESFASAFSSVVGQYEVLKTLQAINYSNELAVDLQRSIQAFQPPALPFIEAFSDQLRNASRSIEDLRQFEETFAGQLLELTREIAMAPQEELEERVEDLSEFLGEQLADSRSGPISLEGYVQILLALILYIHGIVGAQGLEGRVMRRLDNIEAQLKVIAPVEPVERVPELRLVSAATLKIRTQPSTDSRISGELTRNSLVRVIEENSGWARVEYFDFIEGRTSEGWVVRDFLQELSEEFWDDDAPQSQLKKDDARERFERHFGEIDLGYATGIDNEQIDADLAKEHAANHGAS